MSTAADRTTVKRTGSLRAGLFAEILSMAFDTLRANKLRSGLTILGVVIGVTSIVAMTSLIRGFGDQMHQLIRQMGSDTVYLQKFGVSSWASGRPLIEQYTITGMAHGIPLDPATSQGGLGEAGAHMLDVGLSSTDRIAAFFGIAPEPAAHAVQAAPSRPGTRRTTHIRAAAGRPAGSVQEVIERALRAAGLMR